MKAVILAAGKGTRMRELTNELPKPMLQAQGKPILEHIIEGVIGAGIREIFIVTGFKAETIENYFGDGAKWKARIVYGHQLVQDGTGKAPELAREFIGASPFLLTYGDILVKPETYGQMIHRYNEGYFSGVITVTGSEDVTKGGLVFFDDKFCLKRLVEKPSAAQIDELRRDGWLKPGDTAWYNAGIYIFRPSLFEFTVRLQKSPRGEYELTDAVSALIDTRHPIAGMKIAGRWVDVRDPEVLATLENESKPMTPDVKPSPKIRLRIVVAITGASGVIYAQRLLDNLDPRQHEVHVVLSNYAQTVIAAELPDGLRLAAGVKTHGLKSMNVPFASGSNPFDAMVVIPCTVGTLGRIAHGYGEDVLLRAADVMLKERKKLILVPRETPLSLVHIKNFELLIQAGAVIIPANPCFYTLPKTVQEVVDTVVARVLDHLGVPQQLVPRWQEERE